MKIIRAALAVATLLALALPATAAQYIRARRIRVQTTSNTNIDQLCDVPYRQRDCRSDLARDPPDQ